MGRTTKKKAEDKITHTNTANRAETKAKKESSGYKNVTRICSLSRFLNKSFSPIVTSKIQEYRLNDESLTDKSDYQVVREYIKKVVEHHSKTAYLAGVRGSLFFAYLYEAMEFADSDDERDEIWRELCGKNGRTLKITLFDQLANFTPKRIDPLPFIEQVNEACDEYNILDTLKIPEIDGRSSVRKSLSTQIQTAFNNNLTEEILVKLKKRIAFLVDDIMVESDEETKKKRYLCVRQIYNKVTGIGYTDIGGITDSVDAEAFVDESRRILGLPSLEEFQLLEEGEKFKFIVTEKWIAANHRPAVSFLQHLLQWAIDEQRTDEALQPHNRRSIRRPVIFPQFRVDPHFTFLNLEVWYSIARHFGYQFPLDDGGYWNEKRFAKAIASSLPWNEQDAQLHCDFEIAFDALSDFMNLDFVNKAFINKTGFRGMQFDYKIKTDGESCHLVFYKKYKEIENSIAKIAKKQFDDSIASSIRSIRVKRRSPKLPINLVRKIETKDPRTKIEFDSSQELIEELLHSGLYFNIEYCSVFRFSLALT